MRPSQVRPDCSPRSTERPHRPVEACGAVVIQAGRAPWVLLLRGLRDTPVRRRTGAVLIADRASPDRRRGGAPSRLDTMARWRPATRPSRRRRRLGHPARLPRRVGHLEDAQRRGVGPHPPGHGRPDRATPPSRPRRARPLRIVRPGETSAGPHRRAVVADARGRRPDRAGQRHAAAGPARSATTASSPRPAGRTRRSSTSSWRRAGPTSTTPCALWGVTAQLYAARSRQQLGHGRPGRPRPAHRLGHRARRRHGRPQPAARPGPGRPAGQQPLLPQQPPLARPAVPRRRRPAPAAADLPGRDAAIEAGARAQRRRPHRPQRGLGAEAVGARDALGGRRRPAPALDRFRAERGDALTLWGTYCALSEQPRRQLARVARRRPPPGLAGHPPVRRDHADRVGVLVLAPVADRAAVRRQRRRATWSSPTWPWASRPTGSTPGSGRTTWPRAAASAPRPTCSAPTARTGACRRSCPWKLRAQAYQPFAETLRANLRHAAGPARRPRDGPAAPALDPAGHDRGRRRLRARGTGSELLDIVALESVRAGAFVIGEDLGTVDPGIQELLRERGLLSTRLLWFEDAPPHDWPHQAMAAITTHDLPDRRRRVVGRRPGRPARRRRHRARQRRRRLPPPPPRRRQLRRRAPRSTTWWSGVLRAPGRVAVHGGHRRARRPGRRRAPPQRARHHRRAPELAHPAAGPARRPAAPRRWPTASPTPLRRADRPTGRRWCPGRDSNPHALSDRGF